MLGAFFISGTRIPAIERAVTSLLILKWRLFLFPEATALDKLRLKLLESGVIHTVTLKQTESRKKNKKIAAAVCQYQADNDGEWGEIRFDFENDAAEIVRLADWDTVKSNIFAKMAIRYIQSLPEARLLKSVVVPFEMERIELV